MYVRKLKRAWIGQSAAKPRTAERSTTIHYGVAQQAYGCAKRQTPRTGEDMVWSLSKGRVILGCVQCYYISKGNIVEKFIDLTGQTFGKLTVITRTDNDKYGRAVWICDCACGNKKVVAGKLLRSGHTQSCGCLNGEVNSKRSFKDRTGDRFGNLVVMSRAQDYVAPNGKRHVRWLCKCDCGKETVVDVCQLVGGDTKSCGCLKEEKLKNGNRKHGGRKDRLYKVYANMKTRCYNVNSEDYKYYGGRGITICDEWLADYAEFKRWAYKNGYDENAPHGLCTIDRIDVDGNYEPNNCRWVDMSMQSKNRRNVIKQ